MGFGAGAVYSTRITSGITFSSNITMTRAWDSMFLEIPTMTSGTDIYIQASTDGTTFRRVVHEPTIANSTPGPVFFNSSVTNCMVELTLGYYPYVRIELGTAMTAAGAAFKIIAKG